MKQVFLAILTGSLALAGFTPPLCAETLSREEEVLKKIEALEALRETDPAAYQARIRQKKEQLRQKFDRRRGEHPERLRDFFERRSEFRERHFNRWRERRPQAYERFRQKRRGGVGGGSPQRDRPRGARPDRLAAGERFPERRGPGPWGTATSPDWERPVWHTGQGRHPAAARRRRER